MPLGECIKSLRAAAGLQQRELAARVGISKSMLSLVEAGKREPTVSLLRDIGKALNIPTSVLFAVALAEDDEERGGAAEKTREMTRALLNAAHHTLRADRALRERQKPNRRSA